jgi:hypothetical protein
MIRAVNGTVVLPDPAVGPDWFEIRMSSAKNPYMFFRS